MKVYGMDLDQSVCQTYKVDQIKKQMPCGFKNTVI